MNKVIHPFSENTKLELWLHEATSEIPDRKIKPIILIFPGGGYGFCSAREADPVASKYFAQGYHTGILTYHTGDDRDFEVALGEAEQSLALIKAHAAEYNINPDKIYVLGFSAGGHLAAAVSNLGKHKPNACLLGYPALLESMAYLMGIKAPSLEETVTQETPPTFVFTTFEDSLVPVMNTMRYIQALEEKGVPFEAHIFEKGMHGMSVADETLAVRVAPHERHFAKWFEMSVAWLSLQDMPKPRIPRDAVMSVMENEEKKKLLNQLLPRLEEADIFKTVKHYTLGQIVNWYGKNHSSEDVEKLREKLFKR